MRVRFAGCLVALVFAAGCAPMFSDARMLRPGQVEVTPSFSPAFVSAEGETEHLANDYSVRAQVGLTNRISVVGGYNRSQISFENPESYGYNTVAFGPKFSLVPDRVAFAMPVGFIWGDEIESSDTWQLHPTLLVTVPINERDDYNQAVRLLIQTCDNCETLIGFHAGFGVRTGRRLILRPEAAFFFNPGEDGMTWTFGLGASLR